MAQGHQDAKIESSPVWDSSCLTELTSDQIDRPFMQEVYQTGDDSNFSTRTGHVIEGMHT